MALGSIDLNLLVVLRALLEEGNVTRAGMRLGMPQPAVSNALARLRRHYKDELLLRTGNGYELTPLARSLLPMVQESTRLVGQAFSLGQPGSPAQPSRPPVGGRTFNIILSDYSMAVLGGPLLRRMHDLAPTAHARLRLATKEMSPGERGLLAYDLLIAPPPLQPDGLPEVIVRDRIVFVTDPANPRLRPGADGTWRLTAEDLAALPHAAPRFPDPRSDPAAVALFRRGISRNVVLTMPGWLALPFLVAGTDMVAAVPERLARRVSGAAGVAVIEPPFGAIELIEAAWWHPMLATDPALTWLRGVLREAAASLGPGKAFPQPRSLGEPA